jgi:hypothetical protein
MKLRQICNFVLVVAVSAFLALAVFISGCHGAQGSIGRQ